MKNKFLKGLVASFALAASGLANAGLITTVDFDYTGNMQTFTVGSGVDSLFLEVWGASGYSTSNNSGGLGGYTYGYLEVNSGDILNLFVGGQGTVANIVNTLLGGGFNGGGHGVTWGGTNVAGGGGGASDIRIGDIEFSDRIIVAGGGGGATGNGGATGGNGGGAIGADGGDAYGGYEEGTGGTQVSGGDVGGSFGFGGNAIIGNTGWVGGGGGGWFGGGASPAHFGGGGGSSYIGGVTDGFMEQGVRSGNGLIRITYEVTEVPEPSTLAIFALGILGLASRKLKKQA